MSEYQYVAFKAVDRPLTKQELAFAREQSSRADISQWSFQNEYHYGDFRGDANGLLRRGYDVYLHYANFGVRTIALRLRAGLPFAASVFSNYRGTEGLTWKKDRGGAGGILTLSPYFDGGELDDYWQFDECLDATVELRNRLLAGDLRALYVMWICAAFSEGAELSEVIEPPVPGGLPELVEPYSALLEFFGLDPLLLLSASEGAPASPAVQTQDRRFLLWVQGLTDLEAKQLLRKFLAEDATAVQAETIAAIRQAGDSPQWPAASLGRSLEQLQDRTELLRAEHAAKEREKCEAAAKRAAAERERQRLDRMKEMVKQPQRWLREAERLVKARGTANYQAAAAILADLREAVGGDQGNKLSCQHAEQLATKHPTLTMLKSTLRKQGLLK